MSSSCLFSMRLCNTIILAVFFAGLSACASSPPDHQGPRPPPPYVPYEVQAGDAANVGQVLDSIQSRPHGSAPQASRTAAASSAPSPEGSPTKLTVRNDGDCTLGFYLKGPVVRQAAIEAGRSVTFDIAPGSYSFAFDPHLCGGNIRPLSGNDTFAAGSSYTLTVSSDQIRIGTGELVVQNETGGQLTIAVGTISRTLGSGTSSIALPPGSYVAKASGPCGSRSDRVVIDAAASHTATYSCSNGVMQSQSTQVRQGGIGYFEVDNSTGRTLTVTVAGKSHKVKPGSVTIELPVGSHTATISAWCGRATEKLKTEDGSHFQGHYQCVGR